ncbi:putative mitochondrial chaperone BCS1-B [Ananas comosus]|uniref:Putative mitochondrial chaperone BCS1-B n=1 Tax=Ananas comosus TaxID=4615 RepID=A0A199UST7_ANACO|nr:putative mitochondrial chaperone BCS1-B [Ananas comosus]
MVENWAWVSSSLASYMLLWSMLKMYFPHQLWFYFAWCSRKLLAFFDPYLHFTIPEFVGERMKRSEAFGAVEAYLSTSCSQRARNFRAEMGKDSDRLLLSMGDNEELTDDFQGARVWWSSRSHPVQPSRSPWYQAPQEERRDYHLSFHKRHRELVINSYLSHVLREGRAVTASNRQRKLFTNIESSYWNHVPFKHPSTFDTLAIPLAKKREIIDDLIAFRNGKDYYAKIGKAWKRGYLLYGAPGTGKSTMIAAMANFLDYNIYDLELTSVKSNTELRKLFIETTGKSIIVIEDIDCSLDLTSDRKRKKKKSADDKETEDKKNAQPSLPPGMEDREKNKVTLSGLLNFIDGLWSACSEERIIVFTTNHVEELDPALIRRGRMDKHIEMPYCCFEAFKVLAKNYTDVEEHDIFGQIKELLEEVKITPADVAESLMQKSEDKGINERLEGLVRMLKWAKEEMQKRVVNGGGGEEEIVEDN